MTAQQATVTVLQHFNYDLAATAYRVKAATNTTTPKLGEVLTEDAVQALIRQGVKVNIVQPV